MKVDFPQNLQIYHKNQTGPVNKDACEKKCGVSDVNEISKGSTAVADKRLAGAGASVMREVNKPAAPGRLEELAEQIRNNTYHVQTNKIVESILDLTI